MREITTELVCTGDKRDARGRNIAGAGRRVPVLPAMTNQDDLEPLTPARWTPA